MHASFVTALVAAAALVACASASAPDAAGAASTSTSADTAAPSLAGRYPFVLEESEVFAGFKTKCATDAAGDAAKSDACLAEIRAESAKEGIRFDKDAQGHVTWISYGEENGADVTFHQVAIALTSDSPKLVTARTLAPATGLLAAKRPIPEGTTMRVELVDDRTIAMQDPKKGRLVFRRSSANAAR
jgi:acyl-CoA thioesterase